MESILGLYKREAFNNDLRVGTPDPNAYHDISTVHLEGSGGAPMVAKTSSNRGFGGLRGVIIPRASRLGGSRGYDHMTPKPVYIDPEFTNGRLVLDPSKIQQNPQGMVQAIQNAYSQYDDPSDATLVALSSFADVVQEEVMPSGEITIPQIVPTPQAKPPAAPISAYNPPPRDVGAVKAAHLPSQPGFGSPAAVPRAPVAPPPINPTRQRATIAPPSTEIVSTQEAANIPPPGVAAPSQDVAPRSLQAIRSLRNEFADIPANQPAGSVRAMRKVTFELNHGQGSLGQFPCFYHDVVVSEGNLILIYDHSHPAQMVWFPPVLEDPQTKEPIAIAIMVEGNGQEPSMLYLAYPTGVRFPYRNEEFCLLTIEKAKPVPQGG